MNFQQSVAIIVPSTVLPFEKILLVSNRLESKIMEKMSFGGLLETDNLVNLEFCVTLPLCQKFCFSGTLSLTLE